MYFLRIIDLLNRNIVFSLNISRLWFIASFFKLQFRRARMWRSPQAI